MEPGPGSSLKVSPEDIWESLVKAVRLSAHDLEEDDYFVGILEGQMYSLSILATFLGKEKEYFSLSKEIDDNSFAR